MAHSFRQVLVLLLMALFPVGCSQVDPQAGTPQAETPQADSPSADTPEVGEQSEGEGKVDRSLETQARESVSQPNSHPPVSTDSSMVPQSANARIDNSQPAGTPDKKPSIGKDLGAELQNGGFKMSFYPELIADEFALFVRFGSKKLADRYAQGDEILKSEIDLKIKDRAVELRAEIFDVKGLPVMEWEKKGPGNPYFLAKIGIGIRLNVPYSLADGSGGCDGDMVDLYSSDISYSDVIRGAGGYMVEQGSLRKTRGFDGDALSKAKKQGYKTYWTESASASLFLAINPDSRLATDKSMMDSREFRDVKVNLQFSDLRYESPRRWGYFRCDVVEKYIYNTSKIRIESDSQSAPDALRNGPLYFEIARESAPRVVSANLISLEIVDKSGKVFGTYSRKRALE